MSGGQLSGGKLSGVNCRGVNCRNLFLPNEILTSVLTFLILNSSRLETCQNNIHLKYIPSRTAFIADLSTKLSALQQLDSIIIDKQAAYNTVENKILQRLTWAAGANPSTRAVLERFESATSTRSSALETENKYTSDVKEMCGSVVELEQQRLVDEARQAEHQSLLTLFRKFAESTGKLQNQANLFYSRPIDSYFINKILASVNLICYISHILQV